MENKPLRNGFSPIILMLIIAIAGGVFWAWKEGWTWKDGQIQKDPSITTCLKENEACGGRTRVTTLSCCSGMICKLDADTLDGSSRCEKVSSEYIPGTKCNTDSDCNFIKYEKDGRTISLCAVPKEYSNFFNVQVQVDIYKECYCKESRDLGPVKICTEK